MVKIQAFSQDCIVIWEWEYPGSDRMICSEFEYIVAIDVKWRR